MRRSAQPRGVLDAPRRGALCTRAHASTSHHWGQRACYHKVPLGTRGTVSSGWEQGPSPWRPRSPNLPRALLSRGPSKAGTTNDLPIPSSRPYGLCKTVQQSGHPVHPHGTPLLPRSFSSWDSLWVTCKDFTCMRMLNYSSPVSPWH